MPLRVLIVAGDVDGNLGDEAILAATCGLLRAIEPDVAITAAAAPGLGERLGIASVARGPAGTAALLRAARTADRVLVGGGGLFQDDDSLVKMPYWALRVGLLRELAGHAAGWALGVGPLGYRTSRLAARIALERLQPLSVRDERARALAARLVGDGVETVPDPAIALEPASPAAAADVLASHGVPDDGRPLLGVALRRWFPPRARVVPHGVAARLGVVPELGGPEGEILATLLGEVLDRQADRHGVHVVFLPSYRASHEADEALARGVRSRMRRADATSLVVLEEARLYKACVGRLRALLAGRMHPMIMAAGMGTPVAALAYNPKFLGFAELVGWDERVLDVGTFVRERASADLDCRLDAAFASPKSVPDSVPAMRDRLEAFLRRAIA